MDIAVTPIESADDPAFQQAFELSSAAQAVDIPDFPAPCRESFHAGLVHPWPNRPTRHFLARAAGAPAGYLKVVLPDLDNTDNAHVELTVHPDHRRRGVGRELYEYAARVAREEGRKRLLSDTVAGSPGEEFGRAVGAKAALSEVRRRLDLTTISDAALDEQLAAAWRQAPGYSLVQWQDAVPDEYVDDVAYLDSRLIKDAPMGDLTWEPERVDAARIRAAEVAIRARKQRRYDTGVRHDDTGRLVAWTSLGVDHCPPEHAWQQITIVEPRHRGHRLGVIVKIENLRYARAHEPALRDIDTWNAAENAHMIAINEQVGFRAVDRWVNFQHDL
jgi:GNAT superfamily N-acetyltransferase